MRATSGHVLIVGAGPAGSAAAIALARKGVRVTLFERSAFPRDKVCGECVSAVGLDVLERLNVSLHPLGPAILARSTIVAADGRSLTLALPRPMAGVRRSTMDALLLDVARSLGVAIEQPAAVVRIDLGPRIVLRDGRSIAGDALVVADGTSALLNGRPTPTGDFGLKAHFANVSSRRDTIELVGLGDGTYAGLAPVDDDLFNAAWSVPAATMRRYAGDLDMLFADHVARHPWLRRSFARATRVGEWMTCPLPRFAVREDWPAGVIPIGNAAAALEPVGGEGMGLAMRSAELAANAIAEALRHNRPLPIASLQRQFRRLWTVRRWACRAGAVALSDHHIGPWTVDLADSVRGIREIGLRLVGKRA